MRRWRYRGAFPEILGPADAPRDPGASRRDRRSWPRTAGAGGCAEDQGLIQRRSPAANALGPITTTAASVMVVSTFGTGCSGVTSAEMAATISSLGWIPRRTFPAQRYGRSQ